MTEVELKLLDTMLALQTGFNDKLKPDWKTNPPPYSDAIWTEAAEAFDHTNWPWWKRQGTELDYAPIKMELIDIWHFLMSELMCHEESEEVTHKSIIQWVSDDPMTQVHEGYTVNVDMVREQFRNIVRCALMAHDENRITMLITTFVTAMRSLGMDWAEVYKLYVGKNTLNGFRQMNGYKNDTKEYLARWAAEKGWEDNDYLEELLNTLDINQPIAEFQTALLNGLQASLEHSSSFVKKAA